MPTVRAGELRMVMVRQSGMWDAALAAHPSNPRQGGGASFFGIGTTRDSFKGSFPVMR